MLSIKSITYFARHLLRDFKGSLAHYEYNAYEFSEYEGEKFLEWSFGRSADDIRMSVDITLPDDWCKEGEARFARIVMALA